MSVRAVLAIIAGVAFAAGHLPASAREIVAGPIPARVIKVIDGDTLVVRARIWLGQEVETAVRLDGIDTPELKSSCAAEREMAGRARDTIAGLADGRRVVLRDVRYGKYAGRVLARIETDSGQDLATALLERGLGRAYRGGRRAGWCGGADGRRSSAP